MTGVKQERIVGLPTIIKKSSTNWLESTSSSSEPFLLKEGDNLRVLLFLNQNYYNSPGCSSSPVVGNGSKKEKFIAL